MGGCHPPHLPARTFVESIQLCRRPIWVPTPQGLKCLLMPPLLAPEGPVFCVVMGAMFSSSQGSTLVCGARARLRTTYLILSIVFFCKSTPVQTLRRSHLPTALSNSPKMCIQFLSQWGPPSAFIFPSSP